MIKEFFKPSISKILSLIILLALLSFFNFFPYLINPLSCTNNCVVIFGNPLLPFLTLNIKEGVMSPALNIIGLIIDLIIIYLILCALSYIFRKKKKETVRPEQKDYVGKQENYLGEENVPTSYSGR